MTAEHGLQNAIRNALAGEGFFFRANVGQGWTGRAVRRPDGALVLTNHRPFSTGLPPGFSDLFGFKVVTITADMVGRQIAVFTAIECKSKSGRLTEAQSRFLDAVRGAGGMSGVARSIEDALRIVGADNESP